MVRPPGYRGSDWWYSTQKDKNNERLYNLRIIGKPIIYKVSNDAEEDLFLLVFLKERNRFFLKHEFFLLSGRRLTDTRRSCRPVNVNNIPQQVQQNKVIGSSAALNQTTNCAKKGNGKKKVVSSKSKNGNETTSTNLARLILNNLNIFGKFH